MSWEIINQILGLAAIDQNFARMLLDNPSTAIQTKGFQLTAEEQRVFNNISAKNLNELSQKLMRKLHYEDFDQG